MPHMSLPMLAGDTKKETNALVQNIGGALETSAVTCVEVCA